MTSPALDYSPLTGRLGVRMRLRAIASGNVKLLGMTVLGLATLGFGIAFVAAVVSGDLFTGFGLFSAVFFLACVIGWGSEAMRAGEGGRLAAFARVNRLELVSDENAEHYGGSLFADGSNVVRASVRTRGEWFVEIGERWPVTSPRVSTNTVTNTISTEARTATLFLRARLKDPVRVGITAEQFVSPELRTELTEFAGRYTLEVSGREVTVFGSRALAPGTPGRMQEAFGLVDRVVEAVDSECAAGVASGMPSGVPEPDLTAPTEPDGRKPSPLVVIGLTLTLMIVGSLLITVVMSVIDDGLRGDRGRALVVVGLLVTVTMSVTSWFVRLMSKRRQKGPSRSRKPIVVGMSAGVLVAVVAAVTVAVWPNGASDEERLNERYREKIELRDGQILIDGDLRQDCTLDENGWLYCDKQPQPTYE